MESFSGNPRVQLYSGLLKCPSEASLYWGEGGGCQVGVVDHWLATVLQKLWSRFPPVPTDSDGGL